MPCDGATGWLFHNDIVTRRLGDRVKHWITHNEPWCSSMMSYWEGVHAPGGKSLPDALQACHHILLSHGLAIPVIRRNVAQAQVGITLSLHPITAASDSAADQAAVQRHDGLRNRWFLDPLHGRGYPEDTLALLGAAAPHVAPGDLEAIATATDFLGVNYYYPERVQDDPAGGPMRARLVERDGAHRQPGPLGDRLRYRARGYPFFCRGMVARAGLAQFQRQDVELRHVAHMRGRPARLPVPKLGN